MSVLNGDIDINQTVGDLYDIRMEKRIDIPTEIGSIWARDSIQSDIKELINALHINDANFKTDLLKIILAYESIDRKQVAYATISEVLPTNFEERPNDISFVIQFFGPSMQFRANVIVISLIPKE